MIGGFRLLRICGIDIHLDWSLVFIFAMVAFNLGLGVIPLWHPDWGETTTWLVSSFAAVLFVSSVLVHELSHALVAKAHGIPVPRITLFIFGGMANIEREPATARAELLIASAGPVVSLLLGLGCMGTALGLNAQPMMLTEETLLLVRQMGPVSTLLAWLGPVNVILAIFNMVPAFPLDGGRVLRAGLWAVSGNHHLATRCAARTGQAFGAVLLSSGVVMALGREIPLLGSGLVQGMWTAFIGWFLVNAASSALRQNRLQELLEQVLVEELMRTNLATVSPDTDVQTLVREHLMPARDPVMPVVDGETWLGMVGLSDVDKVNRAHWDMVTVAEIMTPASEILVAQRGQDALQALKDLGEQDSAHMPVVDGGRLLGLLWQQDIIQWLEMATHSPRDLGNTAEAH
ncbi:MAG: site-2 protease family protein [Myxococcota bacterium]